MLHVVCELRLLIYRDARYEEWIVCSPQTALYCCTVIGHSTTSTSSVPPFSGKQYGMRVTRRLNPTLLVAVIVVIARGYSSSPDEENRLYATTPLGVTRPFSFYTGDNIFVTHYWLLRALEIISLPFEAEILTTRENPRGWTSSNIKYLQTDFFGVNVVHAKSLNCARLVLFLVCYNIRNVSISTFQCGSIIMMTTLTLLQLSSSSTTTVSTTTAMCCS